ncbi:MAG TPA: BTAD domain-containing putative transcriptional regulator [Pyrinomonadaceae bacterium]|nr:BTAD domain-containing putative transcriptional regulator [Pyrinomonadaceae bacterium]
MSVLKIHLFGKFCVSRGGRPADGFDAHKEQELLSYLLLRRNRPHAREALAGLLWGDVPTEKSKKYLRQALWHVQAALDARPEGGAVGVLAVEHDWVQLDAGPGVWLDVEVFERAFMSVHDSRGAELDAPSFGALQEAVALYRGDLLEGWYQDWCLFERERLQNMYLVMLDKLMCYCEAHRKFELGLLYGAAVLRHDRAHERTHRQLMSLQYLAGDRTAALRQFERCAAALEEELGVKPDRLTDALYQRIRADHAAPPAPAPAPTAEAAPVTLADLLRHLKQIQTVLSELQSRRQKDPAN